MKKLTLVDYEDSYSQELDKDLTVPECLDLILKNTPPWIKQLLQIRNSIVRFLGLKTEGGEFQIENLKKGDVVGFISVEELNSECAIFQGNDKHLTFEIFETTLLCSTLVEFNNLFGRIYFYSILPFHKIIIPAMLSGLTKTVPQNKSH
ncbi:DUF2867 domain-containing protein [bacterium]|nr:DUF2867 domain-containing protein [bacterium]